jgi:flagellar FliJ protein
VVQVAKKFKFKLQSVLNLKEFKEELLKQDLCKLMEKLNEEIEKRNMLMQECTNTKDKLNGELTGSINKEKVIEYNDYLEYLNKLILDQSKIIKLVKQAVNQKRDELLKNDIEKKVIEKLKDKQLTSYTKDINTKTQKGIDDMTIQRFCFNKEEADLNGSAYSN